MCVSLIDESKVEETMECTTAKDDVTRRKVKSHRKENYPCHDENA